MNHETTQHIPEPLCTLASRNSCITRAFFLSQAVVSQHISARTAAPFLALLPRTTDDLDFYGASHASTAGKIQSVAVRIYADEGNAYRTAPVRVNQVAGFSSTYEWHEGERRFRIHRGVHHLRAQIIATVMEKNIPGSIAGGSEVVTAQAEVTGGVPGMTANDILLATSSVDLSAIREGYNYVQLFSPRLEDGEDTWSSRSGESEKETKQEATAAEAVRLMGQLVLRLHWIAPGEGGEEGHATVVIHGASGLAKADL